MPRARTRKIIRHVYPSRQVTYREKEESGWDWAKRNSLYIIGGVVLLYLLVIYRIIEWRFALALVTILFIYISYKTKIFRFPEGKKEYELPDTLELAKKVEQYFLEHAGYRLRFGGKVVGDPELGAMSHTPNVLHFLFKKWNDEAEDYVDEMKVAISVFDWKTKSFGIVGVDDDWVGSETLHRSWSGATKYPVEERVPVYEPSTTQVVLPEKETEEGEEEGEELRYYGEE
ncbi:MAG: hypothetical protein ACTSYD_02105 [Candidatus Heimdallarchaeaceae archaeon]